MLLQVADLRLSPADEEAVRKQWKKNYSTLLEWEEKLARDAQSPQHGAAGERGVGDGFEGAVRSVSKSRIHSPGAHSHLNLLEAQRISSGQNVFAQRHAHLNWGADAGTSTCARRSSTTRSA